MIAAGAETTGRQVAKQARVLCAAGANGVEIVPEPGVDPAFARCSPAELVAAVAEEHLPVGLSVDSAVAAHLAVGAGAAWLRVEASRLEGPLAEALAAVGRPCIVRGLGVLAPNGSVDLALLFEQARSRPELAPFHERNAVVELSVDVLASVGVAADEAFAVEVIAGRRPDDPGDDADESLRGVHAAAVALAVRAGAAIIFTDDPAEALRSRHVALAIREAR